MCSFYSMDGWSLPNKYLNTDLPEVHVNGKLKVFLIHSGDAQNEHVDSNLHRTSGWVGPDSLVVAPCQVVEHIVQVLKLNIA